MLKEMKTDLNGLSLNKKIKKYEMQKSLINKNQFIKLNFANKNKQSEKKTSTKSDNLTIA